MMTKKRFIKFGWLPAHWGLKGKLRDVAQAEHELVGYDLQHRIIEINIAERNEQEQKLAFLALDHEHGKIDDATHEKKSATIKKEPWVIIKSLQTDPKNPRYGGVELDWNEIFIDHLETHGYGPNPDPDDTVNQWFNDLCRNIALEAFDGIGDFQERVEEDAEITGRRRTNIHADAIPVSTKQPGPADEGEDS